MPLGPGGKAEPVIHDVAVFIGNECLKRTVIGGSGAARVAGDFRHDGPFGLTHPGAANNLEYAGETVWVNFVPGLVIDPAYARFRLLG